MRAHDYKKLTVWQDSVDLAIDIYQMLGNFPGEEKYGLVSQIKRSAVSIPSNIAEGAGRFTSKQFVQFLSNANGSACEMDTQLIIANRVGYIDLIVYEQLEDRINKIQRKIFNLTQKMGA